MPFFGLGLHVLVAIYFAVHALRSGQQMYWLIILFSFPLLGSVVYFLAVYLPHSRIEHGARKVARAAGRALDPGRELREARATFDYTPTAHNQMRLARALLDAGHAADAAQHYEACLKGPFAGDAEIRFGAAQAFIASGRFGEALAHLKAIRADNANFRAEACALLTAKALTDHGQVAEARAEFQTAVNQFGSFEVKAEFAIWAITQGDANTGNAIKAELDQAMRRWSRHTRVLNRELVRRLNDAFAQAQPAP